MEIQFGAALRARRKALLLSQQAVADALQVSRNTVINWEADRSKPDLGTLQRLCAVLQLEPEGLFGAARPADEQEERRLLESFRQLSEGGRRAAVQMVEALLEEEEARTRARLEEEFRLFARYESPAAAGTGAEFGDTRPRPVLLRRTTQNLHADALVTVSGDSMEPVYRDGDVLYFRYAQSAPAGADVVCSTIRGAVVKRVSREGGLFSVNPARPFTMTSEADNVRIIGVVTGLARESDAPGAAEEARLREVFGEQLRSFRRTYGLSEWE